MDDPEEDLTERLIEAAGMRMFENLPETGEMALRFTKNAIGEDPGGAIGKGLELLEKSGSLIDEGGKVIKEGEKAIKGAEGIIRGLFGN